MISSRRFRQQSAVAFVSMVLVALTAGCGGSEQANDSSNVNRAADEPATNLAGRVPLSAAPMDRRALLAAVAQAASAATLHQDDSVAQRVLDGKPFEVRIRFGCSGPADDLKDTELGWTYEGEDQVLRVRAMPTMAGDDPVVSGLIGDKIEAAEGFWLPRPWVLQAACPPRLQAQSVPSGPDNSTDALKRDSRAEESAPAVSYPRIGIAQFFAADDSRTVRRDGRPYQATKTLEATANAVGEQGFDLVLSGRLRPVPGGGVIRCIARTSDGPPDCIVGAQFDRVWIEQPRTRELVAEWTNS